MSSLLVGVLLTLAGTDDTRLDLELRLSESATVSIRWGETEHRSEAAQRHFFPGLDASAGAAREYEIHVAGEPPRRHLLPQRPPGGDLRVAVYLPGEAPELVHEVILARIRARRPDRLVLGAPHPWAEPRLVLPELPVQFWEHGASVDELRFGPELQLLDGPQPPESGVFFRLPAKAQVYERPASGSGPRVVHATYHHAELELRGGEVWLSAHALEGSLLDQVRLEPGTGPAARPWRRGLGLALAGAGFFFALLSLVLGRQFL